MSPGKRQVPVLGLMPGPLTPSRGAGPPHWGLIPFTEQLTFFAEGKAERHRARMLTTC